MGSSNDSVDEFILSSNEIRSFADAPGDFLGRKNFEIKGGEGLDEDKEGRRKRRDDQSRKHKKYKVCVYTLLVLVF